MGDKSPWLSIERFSVKYKPLVFVRLVFCVNGCIFLPDADITLVGGTMGFTVIVVIYQKNNKVMIDGTRNNRFRQRLVGSESAE